MEGSKMDACKKIYFRTPAQNAGAIAGILAAAAAMLATIAIC
jgi:hypothetical protein